MGHPSLSPGAVLQANPTEPRPSEQRRTRKVDATGRPTVGQVRLPGSNDVMIVKKDDDDDDDDMEFIEPAEIGNVAKVKNSQGGYTSFGGEISDTAEGTNVGLDPIEKFGRQGEPCIICLCYFHQTTL